MILRAIKLVYFHYLHITVTFSVFRVRFFSISGWSCLPLDTFGTSLTFSDFLSTGLFSPSNMEIVNRLITSTLPNYFASLPIPKSVFGFIQLSGKVFFCL